MKKYTMFVLFMLMGFSAQGMQSFSRFFQGAQIGLVSRMALSQRMCQRSLHDVSLLKGTSVLKDKSPFWGALAFANGTIDRMCANKGPLGDATRLFFYENPADRVISCSKQPDGMPSALCPRLIAQLLQMQNQLADEEIFITNWYAAYRLLSVKHISESNFKKKARRFLRDFVKAAQAAHDPEQIATMLLAFLYNVARDKKDIVSFATAFNKSVSNDWYTRRDLADCEDVFQKKLLKTEEITDELVEKMVFWLSKKKEGSSSCAFLRTPHIPIDAKRCGGRGVCAEETLRTTVNYILYNPFTEKFDLSLLPQAVQEKCREKRPDFCAFIEKYNDPKMVGYYDASALEWFNLLSDIPGIVYSAENCVVQATIDQNAKVLYYLFGFDLETSYERLATLLSTPARTVEFQRGTVTMNEASVSLNVEDSSRIIPWQTRTTAFFETAFDVDHFIRHAFIPSQYGEVERASLSVRVVKNIRKVEDFSHKELLSLYGSLKVMDYFFREVNIATISVDEFHKIVSEYALFKSPLLNSSCSFGWSLLHRAVSVKRKDLVEYLSVVGVDFSKKDNGGNTVLHLLASTKDGDVVMAHTCLTAGTDPQIANSKGETALMLAVQNKNEKLVHFLIEAGSNINQLDGYGRTVLHRSIENDDSEAALLALLLGVNTKIENKEGKAALQIAEDKGATEIVELVKDAELEKASL